MYLQLETQLRRGGGTLGAQDAKLAGIPGAVLVG